MPVVCAVCGHGFSTTDAEFAVVTDAGPVHQNCFEGPFPPGQEPVEQDEEAWDGSGI